nr:immunoglobulin heavy chain junction region [Mus musculus]
CARGSRDFDYW